MKEIVEINKLLLPQDNYTTFLHPKLSREAENKKKLAFILQNSDIPQSIILKAQQLSNKNPYHNFGHQLGVAESAIRIGLAQGVSRKEINLLALVGLFHDAGHDGSAHEDDEERAYQMAIELITPDELKLLGCSAQEIERLILATKFSSRGKCPGTLEKIIQDADLGGIGYGPYYRLYACIGLSDEEQLSPHIWVETNPNFVSLLESINPNIFLSEGARKVFLNPRESRNIIAQRPPEVIDYAYAKRKEDISFEAFQQGIDKLLLLPGAN